MANSEQVTFNDVLNAEVAEIHRRRIAARIGGDQGAALGIPDPELLAAAGAKRPATVGLAISGGGIRSACVGLGLLQSLYRRGILRHIDYLSTVSGGGYVGAYLSSFLATCKSKIDWTPGNPDTRDATKLPFHAEAGAPQTVSVLRMANRGEVMKEPIKFLSRHLWGLITVNLFVFSGLVALGAVAAYLFRLLDSPESNLFLKQLGFQDDIGHAFFKYNIASFFGDAQELNPGAHTQGVD